jgi:hypothetical protein
VTGVIIAAKKQMADAVLGGSDSLNAKLSRRKLGKIEEMKNDATCESS